VSLSYAFIAVWTMVVFIAVFLGSRRFSIVSDRVRMFVAVGAVVIFLVSVAIAGVVRSSPQGLAASEHDVGALCATGVGPAASSAVGDGSIDYVRSGSRTVRSGDSVASELPVEIGGWAVDRATHAPAAAVCLAVDGKNELGSAAIYGVSRPDVAAALHDDALVPVGFVVRVPGGTLARGTHVLATFIRSKNGGWEKFVMPITISST